jgi:DNA-directed RNA polymerase I and III subunit RPAC2
LLVSSNMSVNDYRTEPTTELFNVLPGSSELSSTFIFGNEDHTLGNSLRHILVNREETEFCGYSVPHPYEPKMHIRLQTTGTPSVKVLKLGLKDLEETANLLDDHFIDALTRFKKNKPAAMASSNRKGSRS